MKEFENLVMGNSAIPALSITVILMIAMPVGFFIYWRLKNKQQTNIRYLIAGAVGFIISARVLELGVHYFCLIMDNPVSRFISGSVIAYMLYGAAMAGIFEECGRYIILKYIVKKDHTRENAVMYGIGHGGIEVLGVILPSMISFLVIALMFSNGPTEETLTALNITEETAAAALPTVKAAASFSYGMMALSVIERLLSMLVHIALTVIVFYGIKNMQKKYLPLAILLHMFMDMFAALYQRGVMPLWATEVWAALWTLISVVIAVRLYRKMAS